MTGCQSQTELNRIGIVVAIAIDKDIESGDIILTSQVIRPSALQKEVSGNEDAVELVTAKGKTMFEAIRNTRQVFDRLNFYGHTKVIVVSEKLAEEGITQFLDFLVRGKELRGYTWLCIAKDVDARDVISVKKGVDKIQAMYLKDIIDNRRYHNKATEANVIDFYRKALKDGINPIAGVFEIYKTGNSVEERKISQQVKLSGTAVFINDNLVGYLNEKETQGLNWILGNVESAAIELPSILDKEKFMTLEVNGLESKIEPQIVNDKMFFSIKIKADVSLVEEQDLRKIIAPKKMLDYFEEIESSATQKIEKEVRTTVDKVQKELKSDIFGFGSIFNRKYPKEWVKVKDRWNEVFPEVGYSVEVDINIEGVNLKQGIFEFKE